METVRGDMEVGQSHNILTILNSFLEVGQSLTIFTILNSFPVDRKNFIKTVRGFGGGTVSSLMKGFNSLSKQLTLASMICILGHSPPRKLAKFRRLINQHFLYSHFFIFCANN